MPDKLRTILSVDDREINRYVRCRALRAAGFEVIEAENGAQALRMALAERPSLVLLDVRLPDIDGFTVCKQLKSDPRTAAIPVLHITAAGRIEEDLPQSLEHFSDGCLREPLDIETLVATVKALVRARDAESRAREAERRAAEILESIADPIVAFDRQWRCTYVSRRAAGSLGKTPQEMIGNSMWELFPQDRDTGFERACEQVWAEQKPVTCERYSHVLGTWCENYIYPTAEGAAMQWRDISDRKRAEGRLIESQKRLEVALGAAELGTWELGTWELDVESGVVTASEKTCAMFEFDSARPRVEQWAARMHPNDRERVMAQLAQAAAGLGKYESEYRVLRSDGSTRWVFATADRVVDAQGRMAKLIGVAQDITERKKAEQWTTEDGNAGDLMGKICPDRELRQRVADSMQALTPDWREFPISHKDGYTVPSEWANVRLPDERMIGIGIDVRARKQAEEALRDSERRYSALFGNRTNAMAHCRTITDERGTPVDYEIIDVNAAYEAVTGIRKADIEGRRATEVWPEIRNFSFDYIGNYGKIALEGGELNFEVCFEGLNQWLSIYAYSPKKGEFIAIFTDVTERKRAEAALKESEERFRTMADNIAQFAWMADPSGYIFWYNRRWYEYTGTTFDEMKGWGWQKVHHPEHVDGVTARFRSSVERGETWEDTFPLRGKDGAYRWFLSRAMPVRDAEGRIVRWFGTNTDITEQLEAERLLRESEERLRLTLDSAQVGAFEWWPASGEVMFDSRAKALFAIQPDETADYGSVMARLHPEDRPVVEAKIRASLQPESGGAYESEYRVLWPDGSVHWQISKGRVYFDAEGRPTRMVGVEIDVTEQKRLEEQLRQRVEEMQTIMDVAPAAIWVAHDPECTKIVGNRMANELYEAGEGENVSHGRSEQQRQFFRNGRELSAAELPMQEAAARGVEIRDSELKVLLPSGRMLAMLGNAIPLRDGAGRVRGCVGAFLDTTQRTQAAEQLRRQKQDYETLAENAPEMIARVDRELRHTYINQYGLDVYGLPKEQVLGRTNAEVGMPPEKAAFWKEHFEAVFATGEQRTVEFEFDSPNLGHQHFWSIFVPERDTEGRVASILAITRDVTQLRRAEEQLLESERRLKTVIENLAEGLIVFDPKGETLHWNRAALAMHGFEREPETLRNAAKVTEMYELRTPEGRVLGTDEWPISRLLRGELLSDLELVARQKGHAWERVFSYTGTMVRDEAGEPWLGLLTMRDITERKRTEERLRQAQKLESIGLLAGGIAHDFNNLLTGVLGNASMVLDEVEPGPRARLQEVINSAERAAHLTRQLLAYSGKGQFIVRDLDLSEAVNETSDLVQFSIPKSVDLVLNLQKRLPVVKMDPGQLQQILMNLVINAGEAIGEGNPGKIFVSTGLCDVESGFVDALGEQVEPGRYVSVEVKDTGSGIDEQTRARIFDPFFTTKFTGRGLGLAAVSGIVRSQQGAITLESQPGAGSTFRVLFPARESAGAVAADESNGNRGTVLVVDDEASVRDFIRAALRKRGYRVLVASDGKEALSVCEREAQLRAVVLDVVMPVMGANDLLPEMKSRHPKLDVLLTSGYSESEARRLCAAYPGAAFIQKPYTAQQITNAVEDLVRVKA